MVMIDVVLRKCIQRTSELESAFKGIKVVVPAHLDQLDHLEHFELGVRKQLILLHLVALELLNPELGVNKMEKVDESADRSFLLLLFQEPLLILYAVFMIFERVLCLGQTEYTEQRD
jgi:hypothetical protein